MDGQGHRSSAGRRGGETTRSDELRRRRALGKRSLGNRAVVLIGGGFVGGCFGADIDVEEVPPDPGGVGGVSVPVRSPSPSPEWSRCSEGGAVGLRSPQELRIEAIHAYQGVEVPLAVAGEPVASRRIDLVQGRDLLVRVFVTPVSGHEMQPRERRAHLTLLRRGADPVTFEDVRFLDGVSQRDDLDSTFNFYVPGDEVVASQDLAVELLELGPCFGAPDAEPTRLPPTGGIDLKARATGRIRVRIVPIRFDADGSRRMPDTSAQHMQEMSSLLAAVFPVNRVELTVREPVGTTESDLADILNQLLQLRSLEDPPGDVSYYGLVDPAADIFEYCRFGCVAGVATFGPASGLGAVGVGIGYRGVAEHTFVHEMGHVYRLMHAPCGGPSGIDPDFPHRGARLGSWGYDPRGGGLIDPRGGRRDFMSYCEPSWISDYNYQALVDRLSIINGLRPVDRFDAPEEHRAALETTQGLFPVDDSSTWISTPFATQVSTAGAPGHLRSASDLNAQMSTTGASGHLRLAPNSLFAERRVLRTLHVDGEGRSRWGVPIAERGAPGDETRARVLDEKGREIGQIDVYRRQLSDEQGAWYFVPQPEAGWHSIAVDGLPAHPFAASQQVRAFVP